MIELEQFITADLVEVGMKKAETAMRAGNRNFAEAGLRAARAKDPRLIKVLELSAQIVDKMDDDQFGRTKRAMDAAISVVHGSTEAQMWREAYVWADRGDPVAQLAWIYGAAAWMCGYNT